MDAGGSEDPRRAAHGFEEAAAIAGSDASTELDEEEAGGGFEAAADAGGECDYSDASVTEGFRTK